MSTQRRCVLMPNVGAVAICWVVVVSAGCAESLPQAVQTQVILVLPPVSSVAPPASDRANEERCGEELIINGDFEQPALPSGTWARFDTINGWLTTDGPGPEIQNNVAGPPFLGSQHVELDSDASSAIAQDVPTLEGRDYEVRFAFAAREGTAPEDNVLRVLWNGDEVRRLEPKGGSVWRSYKYRVVGAPEHTRLELRDDGISNGLGTYVDAVSVKLVCNE